MHAAMRFFAERLRFQCSSASRKFLNTNCTSNVRFAPIRFQCSSASRKFLNSDLRRSRRRANRGFSALQRAENSSIQDAPALGVRDPSFSALQRAENSSIPLAGLRARRAAHVSVLFSEPKIPQSALPHPLPGTTPPFQCSSASRKFLNARCGPGRCRCRRVSVLFSEPKIPQCFDIGVRRNVDPLFQCSSASRKFLN